ncbi:hypothetical protein M409DRAFT_16660 [Zasmidium cellare ATCC 36951]|uniref:Enoyl reductase (ER) domain-containing protein n=1 Tax=Zasmidium cellare ATCC 36951 TaxID=1080233 RepID=A0A6A6D3J5_ZASCE|nr:uncharacterized protein M409DRAFT_16660 [Zasmidium cellare ATCC 36951]KAF2172699.1 hypothetical protein M409DRAFT_16660 [Zasmidium cellare ATCC 36951]
MPDTQLPKVMRAWRKHVGNEEAQYDEVTVPKTPPTGFLCKILAAGVCHSDHALLIDKAPRPWFQDRYILGHEGCGEIIDIGPNVTDKRFKIGDVISMLGVPGCGQSNCLECSQDMQQLCTVGHHSGIGQDGFYAPFATIDQRGAVHVPQGVSPLVAAVATDAVTTAYHAIVRRGELKPTETVFLFGLGGLGFNGLQVAKSIGARVIVSDVREERLEAAAQIGIPKRDIVPVGTSIQEFVKENNLMIDTTFDFVGMNQTFEDAQQIVRRGGKMVCIGTLNLDNTVHMKVGIRKRLSIIFSYGGQVKDLEDVLDLIAKKKITPQVETGKLEDFPRWLNDLCDGKVNARVALTPD